MYTLIQHPSPRASDEQWRAFLERMLARPQDDRAVRAAVQAARDALDVRAGKKTRDEIMARRSAEIAEGLKFIRESRERREREQKAKQEKK